MRRKFPLLLLLSLSTLSFAEGTRSWFQSKYDEFQKGTAKGVALRSDGVIELAPSLKPLNTTASSYIWAMAVDGQGNVFLAAGSPARVYRVTPQGQSTVIFQPEELQVQSLAVDADGTVYAATSPDGKIYKIVRGPAKPLTQQQEPSAPPPAKSSGGEKPAVKVESDVDQSERPKTVTVDPSYQSSVFFEPKTKYIWAMIQDKQGRLYVATGDSGQIFRVEKSGASTVFFKSDESHIRALAIDINGNVIAGSDGSGLVYRVSPNGDAFVLYSAPKKEINALAVDDKGNIYAAGVGEKRSLPVTAAPLPILLAPNASGEAGRPGATSPISFPSLVQTGGSEIYRISPDGSPHRVWTSRDDVVYALAFDGRNRLIAGSGNRGRLFVVQNEDQFVDLGAASASQVTSLAKAPNGGIYVATSNLGKVFFLSPAADSDGTYESDVYDARTFSRWGRVQVRAFGNFEIFARSGNVDNPDRNWSPWKKVDLSHDGALDVPAARFVQWRALLHPGPREPEVDSVLVNYLPKNVAPQIDDVFVQVGARFTSTSHSSSSDSSITVGPSSTSSSSSSAKFESSPSAIRDANYIAVRWTARDDNDDNLIFAIYYRGDGETRWKLLKDQLTDRSYSLESALLPDGGYQFRVVASDAPSHSPDDALTDTKDSDRFEVDSTPPQVTSLVGASENGTIHITFRAIDSFAPIKRAEYSIDAGDWHTVEPVGQISDFRVENYDFVVPLPTADSTIANDEVQPPPAGKKRVVADNGEHVVVVRVSDRFDNEGTAKTIVKTK